MEGAYPLDQADKYFHSGQGYTGTLPADSSDRLTSVLSNKIHNILAGTADIHTILCCVNDIRENWMDPNKRDAIGAVLLSFSEQDVFLQATMRGRQELGIMSVFGRIVSSGSHILGSSQYISMQGEFSRQVELAYRILDSEGRIGRNLLQCQRLFSLSTTQPGNGSAMMPVYH